MTDHLPPYSDDAERGVLGAILSDNGALARTGAVLTEADFYREPHRRIFRAMLAVSKQGRAIDPITVKDRLAQDGDLDAVGGAAYIAVLLDGAVPVNVRDHACVVREKAVLRAVALASERLRESVHGRNGHRPGEAMDEVDTAAADCQQAIADLHRDSAPSLEPVSFDAILSAAARPLCWTLKPLFAAGGVRIVSGPGKVGKTTLVIASTLTTVNGGDLAGHFHSDGGHTIAYFDAENRVESWARKFRAVCMGLGLDPQQLIDGGRFAYFNQRGLYLDDPATLLRVIDAAKRVGATEIVLDSLTRIHRQKEADAVAMSGLFLNSIFRLRDEAVAGVTVLHHTRKMQPGFTDDPADALRGSGDLRNVVDTHLSLARSRNDRAIYALAVTAQRDAPEEGPFYYRLDWPPDGGAVFAPADPADVDMGEPRAPGRPGKVQQAINIVRAERGRNPGLTFKDAVKACAAVGIGRSTAATAWGESKVQEVQEPDSGPRTEGGGGLVQESKPPL